MSSANPQLILMIALAKSGPRLLAQHEADVSGHCYRQSDIALIIYNLGW